MLKKISAGLTALVLSVNMAFFCFAGSYTTIVVNKKEEAALSRAGGVFAEYTGGYSKDGRELSEKAYSVTASVNSNLYIDVTGGGSVYGRSTLSSKLASYPLAENERIIAAVNGDFFSSTTGIPLGIQISNGVLQSSNGADYDKQNNHYSVGFKADGSAVAGIPQISISAAFGSGSISIDYANKHPGYNIVLLTSDYADKTYWSSIAHDVIVLKKGSDVLKIDQSVSCVFERYIKNLTEPVAIRDDCWYIIAPAGDTRLALAANAMLGDTVTVKVTEKTGKWKDVVTAISGGNLLIDNGKIVSPSVYDPAISRIFTSRTAIGIKADGSFVFYSVEKDKNGLNSGGVYLEAVSQALADMGCIYAVNIDGGGSTAFAAAPNGELSVKNSPQDGSERKIGNIILLVYSPDLPVVLEDFESDAAFTENYDGLNLINISRTNEQAYTGGSSLKAEYRLSAGATVGMTFEKDYSIMDFTDLMLAVKGDGSGVEIEIVLSNSFVDYTKTVTKADFDSWRKINADIADGYILKGINIKNNSQKNLSGTLYFDRFVCSDYPLTDNKAPALKTWVGSDKYYARVTNGLLGLGIDPLAGDITINGKTAQPSFRNDVFTANVSSAPGNQVNLAMAEVSDVIGNRSRNILLFKTSAYNKAMPFPDSADGKWDSNFIRYCYEQGYVSGIKSGNGVIFGGSRNITRAEFCTMLVKRSGIDQTKYANVKLPYKDASDIPSWAMLFVKAAYAEGIMIGNGSKFNPNDNITRAEAACAACNVADIDTRLSSDIQFTDRNTIPNWAANRVVTITAQGVFKGDERGAFNPENLLTRSESAVIMTKLVI